MFSQIFKKIGSLPVRRRTKIGVPVASAQKRISTRKHGVASAEEFP